MPELVHLLVSEPARGKLSDALHYPKLSILEDCAWVKIPIGPG